MRRSISLCEPSFCYTGQMRTWKFHHTTAADLPKGTRLRFDLLTQGRSIDWAHPETKLTKGTNRIYLKLPNQKLVEAQEHWIADSLVPVYDFTLPCKIDAEQTFTIVMGSYKGSSKDEPEGEIAAQTYTQRRRMFHLYVDPSGKGNFSDPEVFQLDVKGNELATIKILAPSYVVRNRRFDITIRFEDQFGNLTNYAHDETLIEVSYNQQRNNLNWKLFVPETGFITLPNLYFNEEGIYRIFLKNLKDGKEYTSSPIKCFHEDADQLFWGLLHGESETIDFYEETESCLRHFRDDLSYNFFGSSIFENDEAGINEKWKQVNQYIHDFNEEDRFIAFSGFQWNGSSPQQALCHFIFSKDHRTIFREEDSKTNQLKKIYKQHQPKEFIAIPSFTSSPNLGYDFNQHDENFERVAEIYNAWGCSECSIAEGNLFPIRKEGEKKPKLLEEGYLRNALNKGVRIGFVAGGLDDRSVYSNFYDSDQAQYSPGMTAILADGYNRDALFNALYQRKCYATTGPRILLGFYISQHAMGSELSTANKPGLLYNRHIHGFVATESKIKLVEIIRNGEVLKSFTPEENMDFSFELDDTDSPEKISLSAPNHPQFIYYYLRAIQEDGHMAWGSPIWVDIEEHTNKPIKRTPATTKTTKKTG